MDEDDEVEQLLTKAGMLMEDASARLILRDEGALVRLAALRQVINELIAIADAVDAAVKRG